MKYDVISFGSAILDVFIKSPDFKVIKSSDKFVGKILSIPYGIKSEVEELLITSGGGGTNTAVGFARLGLKTAVVARCGWDFAGKMIRQDIKKEKVADDLLVQLEGEKTDYSTILIGPDGNRTILVYRGGTSLEKSVIDFKKLNSFWFYLASLEGNLSLLDQLVDLAVKNHTKVALNPGRREIKQKDQLLEIAQKVDVLIVNQNEASELTKDSFNVEQAFEYLAKFLPKTMVVVTKGDQGVLAQIPGGEKLSFESFEVKMIDQTGAGDGFGCGLVGALASNFKPHQALKIGMANGASVVTQIGAKSGLLKKTQLNSWLT